MQIYSSLKHHDDHASSASQVRPPLNRSAIGSGLSPATAAVTLSRLLADADSPIASCASFLSLFDPAALMRQQGHDALSVVQPKDSRRRTRSERSGLADALVASFAHCVPAAPAWLESAVHTLAHSSALALDGIAVGAQADQGRDGEVKAELPSALLRALSLAGYGQLQRLDLRSFNCGASPLGFLPRPLGAIAHLQELRLVDLGLSALPDLASCARLRLLSAASNRISEADLHGTPRGWEKRRPPNVPLPTIGPRGPPPPPSASDPRPFSQPHRCPRAATPQRHGSGR